MKVLYLASRAEKSTGLELEREITAIQRTAQASAVEAFRFVFLPDIKLEQIGIELLEHKPDVLHISVHGRRSGLWFATETSGYAELTASKLAALLPIEHLPRLIILNACDSEKAACALSELPLVAIGSRMPITNEAAIACAKELYSNLLHGASIAAAVRAMDATVSSITKTETVLQLFSSCGLELERLVTVPQIAAKLPVDEPFLTKKQVFAYIGLVGCPPGTTQVCFFTDDPTFTEDAPTLEESLTEVIRDIPRGGEVWTNTLWNGDGDYRIAACGITADGTTFSSSAMLSKALRAYAALVKAPAKYNKALPQVLAFLRENRGDGLADWRDKPKAKRKK